MKTTFLLNGVEVPGGTRAYIESKIAVVEKMLKVPERAEVEINQDKRGLYYVEAAVFEPRNEYRATIDEQETIEAGIDQVEEMLKEQIRHENEKRETLTRRGARSIKKKVVIDESARF